MYDCVLAAVWDVHFCACDTMCDAPRTTHCVPTHHNSIYSITAVRIESRRVDRVSGNAILHIFKKGLALFCRQATCVNVARLKPRTQKGGG